MFSDAEFLEITNSIFSSFDKVEENGKINFIVNADLFNESIAKEKREVMSADEYYHGKVVIKQFKNLL